MGFSSNSIDNQIRRHRWTRVLPSLYFVGNASGEWPEIRAASLWAGDLAVITGYAAAVWCGWTDRKPVIITVSIGPKRATNDPPGITIERSSLALEDTWIHNGVRCTTLLRTALDLAARNDLDLLDLANRRHILGTKETAAAIVRGTNRAGWTDARSAVRLALAQNAFSAAEREAHELFNAHGITGWVANKRLVIAGITLYPDILFECEMLIVEIDGYRFHGGREEFESDRLRQNIFTAAGYTVLRFTFRQLQDDPAFVISVVRTTRGRLQNQ